MRKKKLLCFFAVKIHQVTHRIQKVHHFRPSLVLRHPILVEHQRYPFVRFTWKTRTIIYHRPMWKMSKTMTNQQQRSSQIEFRSNNVRNPSFLEFHQCVQWIIYRVHQQIKCTIFFQNRSMEFQFHVFLRTSPLFSMEMAMQINWTLWFKRFIKKLSNMNCKYFRLRRKTKSNSIDRFQISQCGWTSFNCYSTRWTLSSMYFGDRKYRIISSKIVLQIL